MDHNSTIESLLTTAWAKRREEKYQEARLLVREAQRLCDENDYNNLGRIFHVLMQFESDHNHTSKALELCQRSLDYYKKSEDPDRIAHSMRHVADLHRRLGNSDDSERCYREAIGIYRRNADTNLGDLVNALRGFGLLLNKQVNKKEAIAVWREVKQLYFECHLHEGVEEATKNLEALE